MDNARKSSIAVELIDALRRRLATVAMVAVASGIALFVAGYYLTPRIEVGGYVEIARLVHVDVNGSTREELVMPALVLAGQINSGVFTTAEEAPAAGNPLQLRRTRIIARVPARTENVELTVRVDSAAKGTELIVRTVDRISAEHRARQRPYLDRLQERHARVASQLDELIKGRRQLESALAELVKNGGRRDSVPYFVLTSLRLQSNSEIKDVDRLRQALFDAIELSKNRGTQLVGEIMVYRASMLMPIALGIFGALLGTAAACAVVIAFAYGRRRRA